MHEKLIGSGQTATFEMHRRPGPFEHLVWLVDRWTPLHFTLAVRIGGSSISVEDMNAALRQCQRRHPVLRTKWRSGIRPLSCTDSITSGATGERHSMASGSGSSTGSFVRARRGAAAARFSPAM